MTKLWNKFSVHFSLINDLVMEKYSMNTEINCTETEAEYNQKAMGGFPHRIFSFSQWFKKICLATENISKEEGRFSIKSRTGLEARLNIHHDN